MYAHTHPQFKEKARNHRIAPNRSSHTYICTDKTGLQAYREDWGRHSLTLIHTDKQAGPTAQGLKGSDTRIHKDSQGHTGTRKDSEGLTGPHKDSQGLTGPHMVSHSLTLIHTGRRRARAPEDKSMDKAQPRNHARTRTKTIFRLDKPPTSDVGVPIYTTPIYGNALI